MGGSYYMSREEVHQGCRGSVSLKAATMAVNPTDPQRFSVEVPGDSVMYLKALTVRWEGKLFPWMGDALSDDHQAPLPFPVAVIHHTQHAPVPLPLPAPSYVAGHWALFHAQPASLVSPLTPMPSHPTPRCSCCR